MSGDALFLGIFINKNIEISFKSAKLKTILTKIQSLFSKTQGFLLKLKHFCQKLKDFRQKLNGPELLSTVMFQSDVKKSLFYMHCQCVINFNSLLAPPKTYSSKTVVTN